MEKAKTYTITIHKKGSRQWERETGVTMEYINWLKERQNGTDYFTVIEFEETEQLHY